MTNVERVQRNVRLPVDVDAVLVKASEERKESIAKSLEYAVVSTYGNGVAHKPAVKKTPAPRVRKAAKKAAKKPTAPSAAQSRETVKRMGAETRQAVAKSVDRAREQVQPRLKLVKK